MNVQSHSSFHSTIFYMTPNIYTQSPLQSAAQTAEFALNFAGTVDKFLAFLNANPKFRQNVQIALGIFFGAAIVAGLVKAISK